MGTEEVGNPDDRLNRQHSALLVGEVGLSERSSLQGLLPLRAFDLSGREEISSEGLGDLELTLRTSVTRAEDPGRISFVAFYGAALPTGKDSEPQVVADTGEFSRGVVSPILGGELSLRVGARSGIHGFARALIPIGDDDGYRYATTTQASAIFSSPLGGSRVRWLSGVRHQHAGRDTLNIEDDGKSAVDMPNRGGDQTRLLGGLLVELTPRQNLGILAAYLLDANLNGDQLTSRTEYVIGWQSSFGAHRHEVQ